jgi:putative ABC transport system substrate-binding protein
VRPGSTRWQVIIVSSLLFEVCNSIQAQQSAKIPRIGVLVTAPAANATPRIQALQQGLHELGYHEGKSIVIEYRYAEGKPETLLERIDELIRLNLELIITDTSNAINTAKNATKTIPIVFTVAIDPVGDGQVSSIARPGGNLTGLSILAPELNGKRLELLRETLPKLSSGSVFHENRSDWKGTFQ